MMDTPLNRAHQMERKAELLFRARKFDDAIDCHEKSAELLKEAMQLTSVRQALESLQLQYNYQMNRRKVIRYKQNSLEKIKLVNQQLAKRAMVENNRLCKEEELLPTNELALNKLKEIHRITDQNDSLLRGLAGDYEVPCVKDFQYLKMPRNEKTIFEELKINNLALKDFVDKLSIELEQSRQENHNLMMENKLLKKQLQQYEMEKMKIRTANTNSNSPFALSQNGDFSPEGIPDYPCLPPLELPNYDFHSFSSSTEDNGTGYESSSIDDF